MTANPATVFTGAQASILIAAYNEAGNIQPAVKRVREILPEAEIIVIDDGSQDQTLEVARELEDKQTKVIHCPQNRGKGHAIRLGIAAATRPLMAQIDADLQFPPEGFPVLFAPILGERADIVFGSRYLPGSHIDKQSVSRLKRWASYVMAAIISASCRQRYTDVFAGFKAWRTEAIRTLDLREDGFTYEAEIAIKARRWGFRVIEVPTDYQLRTHGHSNIKLLYHTCSIAWRIARIVLRKQ